MDEAHNCSPPLSQDDDVPKDPQAIAAKYTLQGADIFQLLRCMIGCESWWSDGKIGAGLSW